MEHWTKEIKNKWVILYFNQVNGDIERRYFKDKGELIINLKMLHYDKTYLIIGVVHFLGIQGKIWEVLTNTQVDRLIESKVV